MLVVKRQVQWADVSSYVEVHALEEKDHVQKGCHGRVEMAHVLVVDHVPLVDRVQVMDHVPVTDHALVVVHVQVVRGRVVRDRAAHVPEA